MIFLQRDLLAVNILFFYLQCLHLLQNLCEKAQKNLLRTIICFIILFIIMNDHKEIMYYIKGKALITFYW